MTRPSSLVPVAFLALGAVLGAASSCQRGARPAGASTPAATDAPAQARPAAPPSLRLYFLVDLSGYLEPCGCNQRPLGGIDRIARVFENERAAAPNAALVSAGNLFFSEPRIEERMIYQERAKAEALTGILTNLRLAAFAPGPADFALGTETWQRLSAAVQAPALAANAGMASVRLLDAGGGMKVGVVGVSDFRPAIGDAAAGAPESGDPVEAARAAVASARAQGATAVVVLASTPRRAARAIASSVEGVDFVVAAREEANAPAAPERVGRAFVLTAPNQGKFLGVLDLHLAGEGAFQDASETTANAARTRLEARITELRGRLAAWERDPTVDRAAVTAQRRRLAELERQRAEAAGPTPPATGRYFRAHAVEVSPDVAKLPAVQSQIASYFRDVNEHNRVEYASLRAPAPQRGVAYYTGIESCHDCHEEAYAVWRGTPHSHAYRTLEDISKNFNLSCVGCHVTGYRQPGGSEVVQNEGLRDVQCETCHGPGSAHVAARGAAQRRATIRRDAPGEFCATQCHTPEHSDHFNYAQYLPRILGPGHGRPVDDDAGTAATDAGAPHAASAAHTAATDGGR
jgi:hypothetical protein